MRGARGALTSIAACALAFVTPSRAGARPSDRVKLVVLISIDQLGTTYLSRWGSLMSHGVERLRRRGMYFSNGIYAYANTETAPGHATIATGAWPDVHGMVANYWYDPQTMRRINCVEDLEHRRSPKNLLTPTVADAIALGTEGRSKRIAIANKDRTAVILGGERPTAAIWYDPDAGRFASGTWYRAGDEARAKSEVPWVAEVAASTNAETTFGTSWTRIAPALDYVKLAGPDDDPAETDLPGVGRTFPHALGKGFTGGSAPDWRATSSVLPQSIDAVGELARRAITEEKLGRRGTVDYLAVGFSTLDYVGHYYGPSSQEALDVVLRIDRAIGSIIDAVDREVGEGTTLWVLTADHGVALAPEHARAMGARAERVDMRPIIAAINEALAKASGTLLASASKNAKPADKSAAAPVVHDLNSPRLYIRWPEQMSAVDRLALRRTAAEVLAARPEVVDARAAADVGSFSEPFRTLLVRTLHRGREPDVLLIQRPHDVWEYGGEAGAGTGTAHGTPYLYDASVPIIVVGPGVTRGEDRKPYEMTRLAPTITALIGVDPPAAAFATPLPIVENQ